MFSKTLFENQHYLVTKGWGRRGAITVYVRPRKTGLKPTVEETEAVSRYLADLDAKGAKSDEDLAEVQRLILAMARNVERRVMRELGERLWNT